METPCLCFECISMPRGYTLQENCIRYCPLCNTFSSLVSLKRLQSVERSFVSLKKKGLEGFWLHLT